MRKYRKFFILKNMKKFRNWRKLRKWEWLENFKIKIIMWNEKKINTHVISFPGGLIPKIWSGFSANRSIASTWQVINHIKNHYYLVIEIFTTVPKENLFRTHLPSLSLSPIHTHTYSLCQSLSHKHFFSPYDLEVHAVPGEVHFQGLSLSLSHTPCLSF